MIITFITGIRRIVFSKKHANIEYPPTLTIWLSSLGIRFLFDECGSITTYIRVLVPSDQGYTSYFTDNSWAGIFVKQTSSFSQTPINFLNPVIPIPRIELVGIRVSSWNDWILPKNDWRIYQKLNAFHPSDRKWATVLVLRGALCSSLKESTSALEPNELFCWKLFEGIKLNLWCFG